MINQTWHTFLTAWSDFNARLIPRKTNVSRDAMSRKIGWQQRCHQTRTNLGGVVVNSSNSNILDALWEITLAWARVRLAEVTINRSKSIWGVYSREDYCTSQCIGEFDLFSMSSKNSRGMDRGIFHRGGLGQESLARQDGGFWPWKEVKSRFILITLYL